MGINIKTVIKGALFAALSSVVLLFIIAAVAYFTPVGDGAVTVMAYIALAVSVLLASFVVARSSDGKRLVHVLLSMALFAALLVIVSFIINGAVRFNAHSAAIIGGIIVTSLLGAVLGNKQ